MSARPDASVSPCPQLSPKAAELDGLSAMRQTMSDFSLDGLSALLDDELSLDAAAPAPQPPAACPPPVATTPTALFVDPTPVPPALTEPVAPPAARLSASDDDASNEPPTANVRQSSLEETQLYKSTPQPTIDLALVRRSASEPTQAFDGRFFDGAEASATIPAVVDPKKSSVSETTFWSTADRDAAEHASMTQTVQRLPDDVAEPVRPSHASGEFLDENSFAAPVEETPSIPVATSHVVPQLVSFFEAEPCRATDARWEQAVESDRQFTTMLLSEMDELPWQAEPRPVAVEAPPVDSPQFAERTEFIDAASADLPAMPGLIESSSLETPAFDRLDGSAALVEPEYAAPQPFSAPGTPVGANATPQAKFAEPTPELRQLAAFLLDRFTPGVSTVAALVGCEATRPGAEASLALAAAVADATGVSTLIVDGDFVRREISGAVDLAAAPGFAEALGQPAKGRSYARPVGRENLNVLPAGNALPQASEAPSRVAAWIAKAKQEYGLIFVWLGDGEGDFARRLCGAADASLLLAAVDLDRPSRIEAASERLRSANARTLGVALVR